MGHIGLQGELHLLQLLAEEVLARSHRVASERDLTSFVTPAYLDARVFVIYAGMPCLVYGPRSESVHGFDERVSLESIRRVTGTIALFIAQWCGLEKIDDGGEGARDAG